MNKNLDLSIYGEMMGEVISNLENEIKELTFKVQKAREDGNWGTYRNLIISYKEVIQLYKEIVDKISEKDDIDKTQYVKNNTTIGLDKNTLDLIINTIKETMENNNIKITNKYSYDNIKTIDLLHDNSYKTKIIDGKVILTVDMTQLLPIKLNRGEEEKALVDTTGFGGIGKTHTLINFAKEKGYNVILPKGFIVKYVRKKYNYEYIYNEDDYILRGVKNLNCVVDEGVDIDRIKNEFGLNIITGYINKNKK